MALPKHRISKARGRKRRTHWKISGPALMECPQCHAAKPLHCICPSCGYYNGREVYLPKQT